MYKLYWLTLVVCINTFLVAQEPTKEGRFVDIHNNQFNKGYSYITPITDLRYKGIIILLHDRQRINVKNYGGIVRYLVEAGYAVVYPNYESFLLYDKTADMEHAILEIKQAFSDIAKDIKYSKSLPIYVIGHGRGANIGLEMALKGIEGVGKIAGVLAIMPNRKLSFKNGIIGKDLYTKIYILEHSENSSSDGSIWEQMERYWGSSKQIFKIENESNNRVTKHGFLFKDKRFDSHIKGLKDYFQIGNYIGEEDQTFYKPIVLNSIECSLFRKCDKINQIIKSNNNTDEL